MSGLLRSRRVGIASTLVLVVLATLFTWFATKADGETVRRAELNDGGIWVTNGAQARFGRLNKPAGQLDAAVAAPTPPNTGLDVVQDGAAVLAIAKATNQALPINVRAGSLVESAALTLPAPAPGVALTQSQVDLRGGTVALVEPATGKLRTQRVDTTKGIALLEKLQAASPARATVGAGAVTAVGVDGTAYAVSAGGQLAIVRPGPAGGVDFEEAALADIGLAGTALQLTVVGTRWAVMDSTSGMLRVDGVRDPIDLRQRLKALGGGPGSALRLQQPGPEADSIIVATTAGAFPVPIEGDTTTSGDLRLPTAATGKLAIAAPVRLGSCVHSAWADAGALYYGRSCSSTAAEAVTIPGRLNQPVPQGGTAPVAADGVALRVNRTMVVLNDLDTGALYDVDSAKPIKVDDWTSVIPPPKSGNANNRPDQSLQDDQLVRKPPEANPDTFNVRPGRTSTLHVLDNDTDAMGSVLAIAPGDVTATDVPGVQVSPSVDGQTVAISVPAEPAARVVHFTYAVNNGTAGPEGRAQTTVTVTIVGDEVNSPPRLRTGQAVVANTRTPVIRGGHVAVAVLADWRDDECDPVVVEALDPGTSVDASGAIAVTAPQQAGQRDLRYAVGDGRGGRTEGKVAVQVLGDTDRPVAPIAQADVVRAVQGKPVQLQPLGNDVPGADPTDPTARMRLAADVRGPTQLLVDTNLDTGVVTVTGSTPGSYLLTYAAQVGSAVGAGRFRVDILAPPTDEAPPVAAPDAATVRDQSPAIADVLANDYSPRSDVLVIQGVATTDPWVRAWVVQGKWLRVQSTTPLPTGLTERRGAVAYTVSDGTRTATGELSVVQKGTAPAAVLPTVVDDLAVVRTGDVVSIPVLDNDSMAEGVPLKIEPAAVKVVQGGGQVFPNGNVLRYVPPATPVTVDTPVTLEYAAYPEGMPERAVTARVTVTVKPMPTPSTPNQPPTARSFSASVTAGEAISITVPTSGIDPDGDLAYVSGVVGEAGGAVNLRFGRVTAFGASTVRYEAYPLSAGTEVIRYVVTDRFGKTGEGLIRVGVVQPGAPQPPVAVADDIVAAPGKRVSIDVLANDLIPRGADVELEDPATRNDAEAVKEFERQPDNTFKVTVPPEGPAKALVYGINGGLFDTSRATITVRGRSGFNNPPVAVDDVARAPDTQPQAQPTATGDAAAPPAPTSALVDVLANDRDVDGDRAALRVIEVGEGATITPDGVRVTFTDHPRAIPYVVQDADGGKAMALIFVPANGSDTPYVIDGTVVTMAQDASQTIRLADHIRDPRARIVRITTPDSMSTSPAGRLTARAVSATEITLTSSGGYVGPAALMLEVTDRTGPDDQSPRTAYVVIPVQIGPLTPLLRCPSWEVNVTAGQDPRIVDIPRLCSAWFPAGLDPKTVRYQADWDQAVDKVTLTPGGEGNRLVRVQAGADAVHGAKGTFWVSVAGQQERFPLRVRVTSLVAAPGAGQPGAEVPPPPPLPVLRPARIEGLIAGQSQVLNLANYLDSPFGTLKCSIQSVRVTQGQGVTGSGTGCVLTVSASPDAVGGVTVLTIDVSDAPDRMTTGTVTVTILSKPAPPQAVSAVADRIQGGTARVSWSPPAYDGGLPILEYQVSAPGVTLSCPSSPCTVSGLTNGVDYLFSVRARNAAGWSEPGVASAPARPDTAPQAVTVGDIVPGDRSLTVSWSAPVNQGSAIDLYNVQVVSLTGGAGGGVFTVPAGSLTTTISGLVNNDQYSIRIQAHNEAGWGPYGAARTSQSVGTPPPMPAPALAYPAPTPSASDALVRISWPDADPNGPRIASYTVWRQVDGGGWDVLATTSANTNSVSDTVPYTGSRYSYAVTATNGGGKSSDRVNAATYIAVGIPEVPRPPSVSTPSADLTMTVSYALGGSRSSGWATVNYRTSTGVSGTIPCTGGWDCSGTVSVSNGQIVEQTMQIQGCNVSGSCSDWSGGSNAFQPYGPTKPVVAKNPSVSGVNGSYDVTFSWDLVTNGRPVTVSVGGADGGACQVARDQRSCVVRGVDYSTAVSISVVASSMAGSAAGVGMSITTPPPATITVERGAVCGGPTVAGSPPPTPCTTNVAECTSVKCAYVVVTGAQWAASTMTCTIRAGNQLIGSQAGLTTRSRVQTTVAWGKPSTLTVSCQDPGSGERAPAAQIAWPAIP